MFGDDEARNTAKPQTFLPQRQMGEQRRRSGATSHRPKPTCANPPLETVTEDLTASQPGVS